MKLRVTTDEDRVDLEGWIVMKVLWRGMLEKLISSGCNFIFNAFWDP